MISHLLLSCQQINREEITNFPASTALECISLAYSFKADNVLTYQVIFLVSVPCIWVQPSLVDEISEDFSFSTMVTVTSWVTLTSYAAKLFVPDVLVDLCPDHDLAGCDPGHSFRTDRVPHRIVGDSLGLLQNRQNNVSITCTIQVTLSCELVFDHFKYINVIISLDVNISTVLSGSLLYVQS